MPETNGFDLLELLVVEVGFLANQSDRDFLSSEAGQEKIARTIFEALRQ